MRGPEQVPPGPAKLNVRRRETKQIKYEDYLVKEQEVAHPKERRKEREVSHKKGAVSKGQHWNLGQASRQRTKRRNKKKQGKSEK